MNSRKAFKNLVLLLFVACSNMVVSAQLGNVEGTISDENGINVPGANIIISELKKGAISDFDGRFSLVGIPAGNYTLNITYLGYADITQEVVVKERETASVSIFITPKTLELD